MMHPLLKQVHQYMSYVDRAYAHHYLAAWNNRELPMADWQAQENKHMRIRCVEKLSAFVEQKHGHTKTFWKLIGTKHRMKIMERPIGTYIMNAYLLDNIWIGYNGCSASRFFD